MKTKKRRKSKKTKAVSKIVRRKKRATRVLAPRFPKEILVRFDHPGRGEEPILLVDDVVGAADTSGPVPVAIYKRVGFGKVVSTPTLVTK